MLPSESTAWIVTWLSVCVSVGLTNGKPIPCTENSLVSKFDSVVVSPFILLNHLPSFSINSWTLPDCLSVVILSTYQPDFADKL